MPATEQQKRTATYELTHSPEWAALTATFDTDQLRAAVGAFYNVLEANMASLNGALPEPFKSQATPLQKAWALSIAAVYLARAL